MKAQISKLLCVISTSTLIALSSTSVNAALYTFSQDGFSGGGIVTGSFEAVDINNDGLITSVSEQHPGDPGEVISFSFSFTNDSIVGDFSALWFNSLIYEIGSGFIGNRSGEGINTGAGSSGVATDEFDYRRFDYETGRTGGFTIFHDVDELARVTDSDTGAISTTSNLISVSESATPVPAAVPIPAAVWLFGTGLIGLIGMRKNSFKIQKNHTLTVA